MEYESMNMGRRKLDHYQRRIKELNFQYPAWTYERLWGLG